MTTNARTTGQLIGLLLLLHTVGAYVLNSVLLGPIFKAPGFMFNAGLGPNRIPLAMLLNLALAGVMLAIAIVARRMFRTHSEHLSLAHVLIVAVGIALTASENVGLYTMQRVSNAYAEEASDSMMAHLRIEPAAEPMPVYPADTAVSARIADSLRTAIVAERWRPARVVTAGVRNGAHFTSVFVAGAGLFLFYALLFRGRHIPRLLAGATALTALVQMFAVGRPFFGSPTDFRFLMPVAVMHLLSILWMIAKGFDDKESTTV